MIKNKTAAILPSKGIGDALLMMIAAQNLLQQGFDVTTFHESLLDLQAWFTQHKFEKRPKHGELKKIASHYDLIIVQNDNSETISTLIQQARSHLSIFYPSYQAYKHPLLSPLDQVFFPHLSMAENIAKATASLLNIREISKDNGLKPLDHLIHRKYKKRIAIHPTSSLKSKNWSPSKFLALAKLLHQNQFDPVFVMSDAEKKEWEFLSSTPFSLQAFKRVDDLAAFLYESAGLVGNDSLSGHLASNLQIPTIIVADNQKLMQLWRPGWLSGVVVTPPLWIPNFKGMRIREKWWRHFISPKKIFKLIEKKFH